jgi:hypothetical protein
MKKWKFVGIGILVLAVLLLSLSAPVWSQGRGQGFRPCPYTSYVCPVKATCKSFEENGQVVQVFTESLEDTMQPGMAVLMNTKTRGQVHVHLGPVWYLERQEFELKPGDEVKVKGMCEQETGAKKEIIAYELSKGDYVLSLRDSQGRPNWEAWRKR